MSQRKVRALIVAAVTAALSLTAGVAVAKSPQSGAQPALKQPTPQQSARRRKLEQAQKRMQALRQELGHIREAAFKHHPKLKKEQSQLTQLVRSTMKKNGDDPAPHQQKLKELRAQYQKKDLKKGQRQKIIQQAEHEQEALRQGYTKALKDKKVQRAQTHFRHDVLAAMDQQNPKTQKLISEYRQERARMIHILTQGRGTSHGHR